MQLQTEERYEECSVILNELDKVITGRRWYLDTKVDDQTIHEIYLSEYNPHTDIEEYKSFTDDNILKLKSYLLLFIISSNSFRRLLFIVYICISVQI